MKNGTLKLKWLISHISGDIFKKKKISIDKLEKRELYLTLHMK